eukprot:gene4620-6499_t
MDLDLFDGFKNSNIESIEISSLSKRKRSTGNSGTTIGTTSHEKDRGSNFLSKVEVLETNVDEMDIKSAKSLQPAKTYKFELDSFQKEAIRYIEIGESVLVAAHTSAGKTAVAEYAIAKSLRDGQRVIYTSPIKALSNQKYRDLQEEFSDVGLMTGDMTINPTATCLIMTTEILRSMLYRGSEVMREVAWVIYDEVHYMRDKERGVVWEESIILLPHKVRFVFLSATIPNAAEFVSWVSKIHHQPCHVVYTEYRPVPLQHFVFPIGAEGLYLVVDEKSCFREDNFQKAMSYLQGPAPLMDKAEENKQRKKNSNNINSDLFKIVKLIMDKELDPCIIFSFSKKDCETYALQMARMDFNNNDEKDLVEQVFLNAMEALSEDDKTLPQVVTILPLLKRGVGIHHGGLLPILKEVIEILFQEGLVKCLFATETFSIGINMPAKTVVFTKTRKYDGKDFRWITSGEYIQMSGRAGRRGKDDRGIVIQMLDEKIEPDIAKNMIYGASDPLFSSFHIGYNMVLNMLRVEDANPENIISSSFHQYQQEKKAPELELRAIEYEREASLIYVENEESVSEYQKLNNLLKDITNDIRSVVMKPSNCSPFLQSGRLIQVGHNHVTWGWGVVINFRTINQKGKEKFNKSVLERLIGNNVSSSNKTNHELMLDVLIEVQDVTPSADETIKLNDIKQNLDGLCIRPVGWYSTESVEKSLYTFQIVHVSLDAILSISAVRLNVPKNLNKSKASFNDDSISKAINEVKRRFKQDGIPLLDPIKDMSIPDESLAILIHRQSEINALIKNSAIYSLPNKDELLSSFVTKAILLDSSRALRKEMKETQAVFMRDELKKMKQVLRKLEFVNSDGVLSTKGRFSCELSTADELVLTSMVFDGIFNSLSVEQSVSLLSCFVHKEGGKDSSENMSTVLNSLKFRSDMHAPFRQLIETADKIARVCIDCRILLEKDDYLGSFNPGLIDVTYLWSNGGKFAEICKLTDIFEGSIIRVLRRLEELLRQLASAASAIGNSDLMQKFNDGSKSIRRGVVFAASLYL